MRTRLFALLNATLLGTVLLLALTVSEGFAFQDAKAPDKPATQDIIYMSDGRVLHGQITNRTKSLVIFEYHDAKLNNKTKMTLAVDDIAKIEENVPLTGAGEPESPANDAPSEPTKTPDKAARQPPAETHYGAFRVDSSRTNVPSIYIVPMKGQMGTDIRSDVYKDVVEDIRKHKPDVLVFKVESADAFSPELMHPTGYEHDFDPRNERGLLEFEDYRELVHMFRDGLRDLPKTQQVVWIHDSDGISAVVSMAWDKIYMTPKARLGGMITVLAQSHAHQWADSDVRAKMMAAWLGMAKSFLEKGKYSLALADAMLHPETVLSGSWKGRKVEWMLNTEGEYVVDGDDKRTADFVARTAEDFCISQGTAAELDDLALLLGYREYRVLEGRQRELTEGYVENWRRAFANCRQWLKDYDKHNSWAQGEDQVKFLGRAKQDLENVLRALDQYKAVEIRLEKDFGVDRTTLVTTIEQIKELLASMKNTARTRGGSAGGGRGSGLGN